MTRAVSGAQVRSAPDGNLVIGVDGDPRAWVRVANIALEGICFGALGAGGRIPPAAVLAAQAGCAAGTVRRALRHPAAAGLIAWYPGAGYRVVDGAAGTGRHHAGEGDR